MEGNRSVRLFLGLSLLLAFAVLCSCGGGGDSPAPGPKTMTITDNTVATGESVTYMAASDAHRVVVTLPASPVVGNILRVIGSGQSGWSVVPNAGQTIGPDNLMPPPGPPWRARRATGIGSPSPPPPTEPGLPRWYGKGRSTPAPNPSSPASPEDRAVN